jgi:hypothetical protein
MNWLQFNRHHTLANTKSIFLYEITNCCDVNEDIDIVNNICTGGAQPVTAQRRAWSTARRPSQPSARISSRPQPGPWRGRARRAGRCRRQGPGSLPSRRTPCARRLTGPSLGADERAGDEAVGRGGDSARGEPRRRRKRRRPI